MELSNEFDFEIFSNEQRTAGSQRSNMYVILRLVIYYPELRPDEKANCLGSGTGRLGP